MESASLSIFGSIIANPDMSRCLCNPKTGQKLFFFALSFLQFFSALLFITFHFFSYQSRFSFFLQLVRNNFSSQRSFLKDMKEKKRKLIVGLKSVGACGVVGERNEWHENVLYEKKTNKIEMRNFTWTTVLEKFKYVFLSFFWVTQQPVWGVFFSSFFNETLNKREKKKITQKNLRNWRWNSQRTKSTTRWN